MSECRIMLHREVPPEIVRLVHEELAKRECVSQIIFTGACPALEGHMAVFAPDTGSVVIDLDACVKDLRWMDHGSTFVSNAWFNLLYCIFHESWHAGQVFFGVNPNEEDCDEYARNRMFDWLSTHKMPKLAEMGYLTDAIKKVLNAMWGKHQHLVELEINVAGVAAAHVFNAATKIPSFENQRQIASLVSEVMEGRAGKVVDGEPYLTADEFIVAVDSDVKGDSNEHVQKLANVLREIQQSNKKMEASYA